MTSLTSSTSITPSGTFDAPGVALGHLRQHGIDDPHVDEVSGQLYLRGIANCYKSKQAAAKSVAQAIPGLNVVNELRVVHEVADDANVAAAVGAAIRRSVPAAASTVRVLAISGDVYLRGMAPDPDTRERLEAAAWESVGVMRVHNELTSPGPSASDDELARDISRYLSRLVTLQHGPVSVAYGAGNVHLQGEVASSEQRDMIEELVRWHEAVRDVTNDLRVRGGPNLS